MEFVKMDPEETTTADISWSGGLLSNADIKGKILSKEYIISPKRSRSKVWEIFGKIETDTGEVIPKVVACRSCLNVYKFTHSSTSNLVRHKCYVISKCNAVPTKLDTDTETKENAECVFTQWIIENCRSFRLVEDSGLSKFAVFLIATGAKYGQNVDIERLLPHPTKISRNIYELYSNKLAIVKTEISAIKDIGYGLTTDIWTDNYLRTTYLSLTMHYIKNGELINRLLGVKSMEIDNCTSENVRLKVLRLLKEFDCTLDDRAFIVTGRNATMLAAFRPYNHLCCINNLLHNALEQSIEAVPEIQELGHTATTLVRFLEKSGINYNWDTTLERVSLSRWHTIYSMLAFIEKHWQEISEILEEKEQVHLFENISFTYIEGIRKVLEPFENSVKELESETGSTLHLTIVHIHRLKKMCIKNLEDLDIVKTLKLKLINFLESHVLENMTMHHKIALYLFPPANKLILFNESDKHSIRTECKLIMKTYFNEITDLEAETASTSTPTQSTDKIDLFLDFVQTKPVLKSDEKIDNELRIYEGTNVVLHDDFDLLQWWHLHQAQFPLLYKMSCKILAVPASSGASERALCKARRIILDKSSVVSANPTPINELVFLHSNMERNEMFYEIDKDIEL